jgi:hypothetical protein
MQRRFDSAFRARIALVTLVACLASTAVMAQSRPAPAPAPVATEKEAPPAKPANLKPAVGYIIVDLTADPKDPDATQVMTFDGATAGEGTKVACETIAPPPKEADARVRAVSEIAGLVECAASDTTPIKNRILAAERIRAAAQAAAKQGTTRFITTKGEIVRVVVIDKAQGLYEITKEKKDGKEVETETFHLVRGKKPSVGFKENARQTQISTDIKSLVQVAAGILGADEPGLETVPAPPTKPDPTKTKAKDVSWAFVSSHGLGESRATVSVSVEAGQATTLLARRHEKDGGLLPIETDEEAAVFVDRWEAAQVAEVKCVDVLSSPRATPLLILTCRAKEPTTPPERITAIEGLGTLGDAKATSTLRDYANGTDAGVRNAALIALSKLKTAAGAPAAAAVPAKAEAADEAAPKPSVDVITGPREHWFLSADVPITAAEALTFDKDTGQVTLGDEPSTFYLGVNFLVGDLKDPKRSFIGNVVVKGLLKASNRPLDSYGFALGLRGQYLSKLGLNLDALTPLVAMTFTQEDVEENGVVTRRARRNSELRFGVSLNLDQAVKWVGGK